MAVKVFSAALSGFDSQMIEVEVDFTPGLHSFSIVGLPDKTVEESKERISSAIKNSGAKPPSHHNRRITVNLAPADLKKQGSAYDLPIAVGFLLVSSQISNINTEDKIFIGELSLDGRLKPIRGVLPIALLAKKQNKALILPKENQKEAEIVEGLRILGIKDLGELFKKISKIGESYFIGKGLEMVEPLTSVLDDFDFSYIQGQERVKRALEIVAAGAHHIFMVGPPGVGKTLLSKALSSILPPLIKEEILEVTKIYSINGLLSPENSIIRKRPFRTPHHTASSAAIIGGGSKIRIGEVTLAHRGVLFLDEFPEFRRDVLEALRQPIEEGIVSISRANESFTFPADFILVTASNPCPCGFLNEPERNCNCTPSQINRYERKFSGPIMDRIDIKIRTPRISFEKLISEKNNEESKIIKERVIKAREIQKRRLEEERILTNSKMTFSQIKKYCKIDLEGKDFLKKAVQRLNLSPRSYHKVLKVARTITDLEEKENIEKSHLAEAISYQELMS